MKQFIVLSGLVVLSVAQFPQPAFPDIPGVTPPPWQGPIADHINGIPPQDTPEVAAAKAALNRAYAQVLAVLPELPAEERYRTHSTSQVQHVPIPRHQEYSGHHHIVPQSEIPQHVQPTASPIVPTTRRFAEEIPRSSIGEVPEVHAARVAHLKAIQDATATLPRLADTYTPQVHQVEPAIPQHPGLLFQNYLLTQQPSAHHLVQDTPEVARAKAEHAAAVAAALG